jgi:beta-N-acetylhexosaminidase
MRTHARLPSASMSLSLEHALGQKLMLSFGGTEPSAEILAALSHWRVGGVTLFRALNVESPAQVRALTQTLQRAAAVSGQPPLLIAVDQEGGQLMALTGTTPFPGNLALGATGSAELARRTGHAIGRELAAMGINVNYAPVCDVNVNPENPVVGTRSFGGDPALVAQLSAATIEGIQAAGVAATAKHFPGHGDTAIDSHHATPILPHDETRLRQVELRPFAAAVQAGAKLVMTAHVALPALSGSQDLPATLSPAILRGLLRRDLGFEGVIISDAMDMKAIRQGPGFAIDAIAALAAGIDLLTLNAQLPEQRAVFDPLLQAAQRMLIAPGDVIASAARVLALKEWCAQVSPPPLEVVGCAEHRALAFEVAARSVTLVRDHAHRLPLNLPSNARLAVVEPEPQDLTPADTSSYEKPALAEALRAHCSGVDEFIVPINPSDIEIAAVRDALRACAYDLVIIGTINATNHPGQAALVNAILESGMATVAAALRMPYDVLAYPQVPTYVCTYSLQPPALESLAQALWGQIPFVGRLPVSIPGL